MLYEVITEADASPFGKKLRVAHDGVRPGVEEVSFPDARLADSFGKPVHPLRVAHRLAVAEKDVRLFDRLQFLDYPFRIAAKVSAPGDRPKRAEVAVVRAAHGRANGRHRLHPLAEVVLPNPGCQGPIRKRQPIRVGMGPGFAEFHLSYNFV